MAVLSVAFFAGAVPAQAATHAQVYRLQPQPESVALVTDNSSAGTTDTAQLFRLHTRPESVPLVTDNSGKTAATTPSQDYGPLDPIIANAVRESSQQQSYGPLDPIIANAVRESSQLDPIIANAVRESKHPSSMPTKLTTSARSSSGFDWRDTGIGLAAFSAIMALGFAGMTAKRRRGALA
jgi:hypothetical protein